MHFVTVLLFVHVIISLSSYTITSRADAAEIQATGKDITHFDNFEENADMVSRFKRDVDVKAMAARLKNKFGKDKLEAIASRSAKVDAKAMVARLKSKMEKESANVPPTSPNTTLSESTTFTSTNKLKERSTENLDSIKHRSVSNEANQSQGLSEVQNGNNHKSEEQPGKSSLVQRFLNQKKGGNNTAESSEEKQTTDNNTKKDKTDPGKIVGRSGFAPPLAGKVDVDAMIQQMKANENIPTGVQQPGLENSFQPPPQLSPPPQLLPIPQPQPISSTHADRNWLKSASVDKSIYETTQGVQQQGLVNSFQPQPQLLPQPQRLPLPQPQPISSNPAGTDWLKSTSVERSSYAKPQDTSSFSYQPPTGNFYSTSSQSSFGGGSSLRSDQQNNLGTSSFSYQPSPSNLHSTNYQSSFGGGSSLRSDQQNKEGLTGYCNVGERRLRVGDKWTVTGICGRFTCQGNNFRTLSTECPALRYQEGASCDVEDQDISLEFPKCCPKLVCSNAVPKLESTSLNSATPPISSNTNKYKYF